MNAYEVRENVERMYAEGIYVKATRGYSKKWRIAEVCDELSIFDWWNENLSMSQLKQMKDFLDKAIDRGFDGYVCFKVGAKYCSHGMWAHKKESETGYSPDGACLFHSFRSGDNYWDMCNDEGKWLHSDEKCDFTLKEIDTELAK